MVSVVGDTLPASATKPCPAAGAAVAAPADASAPVNAVMASAETATAPTRTGRDSTPTSPPSVRPRGNVQDRLHKFPSELKCPALGNLGRVFVIRSLLCVCGE